MAAAQAARAEAAERAKRFGQVLAAVAQARASVWDLMQRRVAVFVGAAPLGGLSVEQCKLTSPTPPTLEPLLTSA